MRIDFEIYNGSTDAAGPWTDDLRVNERVREQMEQDFLFLLMTQESILKAESVFYVEYDPRTGKRQSVAQPLFLSGGKGEIQNSCRNAQEQPVVLL